MPPEHLQASGRALWDAITSEFHVGDAAGVALLQSACEARDRAAQAQDILRKSGLTTTDARGSVKAHPAVGIERDAWNAIRAALRQLNLEFEPAAKIGRPASRR